MFVACVRFMLSLILSPRRLLLSALVATFVYAALVATKARVFPDPALRAGNSVPTVPARTGGRGVSSTGGTRSE